MNTINSIPTLSIGVDIGGTNAVFGIVNEDGRILQEASIRTQEYPTADTFVEASVACIRPLIANVGGIERIKGMGIGAPNGNFYTGCIELAPNLPWKGIVPLAEMFHLALGIPTYITNDANAAAMGEMVYGTARGMKNFIMITLGTGVGSGIVVDGKLVYGSDGFAGELGHFVINRTATARRCGCGRCGCLETYCSATGVVRTARELLQASDAPSLLRNIDPDKLESKDVSIAANQGDALALQIFQRTGEILGEALSDFTTFSSPEAYILFGGLMHAGDLILRPIQEAYDRNVMPVFRGKTKILVSTLMNTNAAILGAAALTASE